MENFLFSLILLILVYFSSAASEVLSTGEVVAKFVAENLAQYDVMIFSKSYCPYCRETKGTFKRLLGELGFGDDITFNVIELDTLPENDGPLIQNELYEITGQSTVPNVFIRGMHIGGNSDVQNLLQNNELTTMIHAYN